jgi:hypothetical protein
MSNADAWKDADPATIASFGRCLEEFARTLTESEQRMLSAVLCSAMDPLDRIRLREAELFSEDEKAILAELENEHG